MPETIFSLRDVVKVYDTGAGGFRAIKGVSFDVTRGEFLGIVGKSGAGKTTLLNIIAGVSEISSGRLLFFSEDSEAKPLSVGEMSEDELAAWRGQNLGIVYQSFELLPQLDLVNNIMLPREFAGQYQPSLTREQAMDLLESVELTEHAHKLPAHISGGQMQRIAIARALVNDPAVIVADEPTGSLDTVTAERIFNIFTKLVRQGKTVIMVTHDLDLTTRFTRTLLISDGKLFDEIVVEADPSTSDESFSEEIGTGELTFLSSYGGRDEKANSHDTSKPAIHLQNVVKTYVNAAGEFPALKSVDMEIEYGEFVSLVGKSGSGKSTLLNMLTGIDHPTSGAVLIGGEDIYSLSESKRALWRGRNVGIVFQFFQLLPTLTLLENTMLPMDYCDVYKPRERSNRAMELLKMVGLEDSAFELPASVSNGQQQAAAIARSLATDPPIIVADEPTGNLDTRSAGVVIRVFKELAKRGKTILVVTHDTSLTGHTDRTIIISDGEFIDPTVATVLPTLDHPHMLSATHSLERRIYKPGEIVLRQGEPVNHLYIVANGRVAIFANGSDTAAASMGLGEFFGEIELLGNDSAVATVRAAVDGPLELALLPKDRLYQLMDESPATLAVLKLVAHERYLENLTHRIPEEAE
jgi:ABC-type lipoprotein export system ATPase subunit